MRRDDWLSVGLILLGIWLLISAVSRTAQVAAMTLSMWREWRGSGTPTVGLLEYVAAQVSADALQSIVAAVLIFWGARKGSRKRPDEIAGETSPTRRGLPDAMAALLKLLGVVALLMSVRSVAALVAAGLAPTIARRPSEYQAAHVIEAVLYVGSAVVLFVYGRTIAEGLLRPKGERKDSGAHPPLGPLD